MSAAPRPDRLGERVLAVRLDAIGDVLLTSPALGALRAGAERRVTLLTSPAGASLAGLLPDVDEVIAYEAPWMKASGERPDPGPDLEMIERLRAGRFDAAVIFTVYSQSPLPAALQCYLAGIPVRAAHCRENPYQLLSDWVREEEPELARHEVERQLDLVAHLGCRIDSDGLRLRIPPAARGRAEASLRGAGVRLDAPWLLLHPGASASSRRYPLDGYARAARTLVEEDGWQVVLAGAGTDAGAVEEIRRLMAAPAVGLAGALDLGELAAAIEMADLFIGNNSAPAHLAAAVGTPAVVLYALTNPQHTPWRVPTRVLTHDVPCRNCYRSVCPMGHHACLRGIKPEEIVVAARQLRGRPAAASRLAGAAR